MSLYLVTAGDDIDEIEGIGYYTEGGELVILEQDEPQRGAATYAAGKWDSIVKVVEDEDESDSDDHDYYDDFDEAAEEDAEAPETNPWVQETAKVNVKDPFGFGDLFRTTFPPNDMFLPRNERNPDSFPTQFGRYA